MFDFIYGIVATLATEIILLMIYTHRKFGGK